MATGKKREPDSKSRSSETPPYDRVHVWQIQAVRDLLLVAAVVGVVWIGYALRAVTVPLLVALLLAYLFEPLIERLCKNPKVSRTMAVGGLLATVGVAVLVVIALAVPLIIGQTTQFIGDVRDGTMRDRIAKIERFVPETYTEEFQRFLDVLPGDDGAKDESGPAPADETAVPPDETRIGGAETPDAVVDEGAREEIAQLQAEVAQLRDQLAANDETDSTSSGLLRFAGGSINTIVSVLGAIVQLGLVAFLIPFYFFFFSLWYADVVEFARGLFPQKNRTRILELLDRMDRVIAGFVRGRIVISMIMGVMLAIGWMICGVPYSIPLGLVVGVFCAVPYLGVVGIPLAVGLLFFERVGNTDGGDLWWLWVLLWPTVVFAIVQLIEGYVLTPKIAGKATNLDPVTIIVAVLAGGSVLGVYGMLLAIPLTACGKILFTDVLLPSIHAWTRGESADPLPFDRE